MEEAAKKTEGVQDAVVNFMTQKMIVEFREGAEATITPENAEIFLRSRDTGVSQSAITRMERQQANALAVARWLQGQPGIEKVFYVGLPEHPGYAVNAAQAKGSGSMISFRTDTAETAHKILNQVKLITFAESLGGTESLITYPLTQTHPDVPEKMRQRLGITDTLLRLSVGLEYVDDIICDLKQALEA